MARKFGLTRLVLTALLAVLVGLTGCGTTAAVPTATALPPAPPDTVAAPAPTDTVAAPAPTDTAAAMPATAAPAPTDAAAPAPTDTAAASVPTDTASAPADTAAPEATSTTAPAPAVAATATPAAATATTVQATLREWALDLSTTQVAAGAVHFVVNNTGMMAHNFTIKDQSGTVVGKTSTFPSGQSPQTLDVTLAAGTYTVYCSLPGHAARGQQNTLVVK